MDIMTLTTAATAFIASQVLQKCASAAIDNLWRRASGLLSNYLGREPTPSDIETVSSATESKNIRDELRKIAGETIQHSSALRRAQLVEKVVKNAAVLWIDDNPEKNLWECLLFRSLAIDITSSRSTSDALHLMKTHRYDLILSDIRRGDDSQRGITDLPLILSAPKKAPVVFYIGNYDQSRGLPAGSFGMTNNPEELIHLMLDVLERSRV